MESGPGRVKREYNINLARPRHQEDAAAAEMAGKLTVELKAEVAAMSADVLEQRPMGAPPNTTRPAATFADKAWATTWPKLLAVGIAIGVWQLVVWSGWKPEYLLPGPGPTFSRL